MHQLQFLLTFIDSSVVVVNKEPIHFFFKHTLLFTYKPAPLFSLLVHRALPWPLQTTVIHSGRQKHYRNSSIHPTLAAAPNPLLSTHITMNATCYFRNHFSPIYFIYFFHFHPALIIPFSHSIFSSLIPLSKQGKASK